MRFFFRRRRRRRVRANLNDKDYRAKREEARARITARLEYWATMVPVPYARVAIRNQSTRWGSCSKKRNLNFNYRIAFMAPELMDYVIVHELCHLVHFNHSRSFWNLLGTIIPDYDARRLALRDERVHRSVV